MKLLDQMTRLVVRTHEILGTLPNDTGDAHRTVCVMLADEFDLWADDSFPIWLSRVVAGEMSDF